MLNINKKATMKLPFHSDLKPNHCTDLGSVKHMIKILSCQAKLIYPHLKNSQY